MKKSYLKFLFILVFVISIISVAYAAFSIDMNIDKISALFRIQKDVRITDLTVDSKSDDAVLSYDEYNFNEIIMGIKLPSNDSYVTYNIDVTNLGSTPMVIENISGFHENLTYSFDNYELNSLICNENNECNLGITKSIKLTIKHKKNITEEDSEVYNLNLKLEFGEGSYTVNYYQMLPVEYQAVEYIESTGTQFINTGIIPSNNLKTEIVYEDIDLTGSNYVFGAVSVGDLDQIDYGILSNSLDKDISIYFNSVERINFSIDSNLNSKYKNITEIKYDKNKGYRIKSVLDNITLNTSLNEYSSYINGIENDVSNIYVFGIDNGHVHKGMRLYSLAFWDNGDLIGYYVPCYRKSDNVVGLYNMVNKIFYTNEGTLEFKHGNEIYDEYYLAKNQVIKYGVSQELKLNNYLRTKYNFVGWNTDENGKGLLYSDGEPVSNLSKANATEIDLYSQWELKSYEGVPIYDIVGRYSVPENITSNFVSSQKGIDFSNVAGSTNGLGVYTRADTLKDTYPIHYYRGLVEENNVLFADVCWKIIRTTETGGTKLIYNGLPSNGTCNNSGLKAQLPDRVAFNSAGKLEANGYSYGKTHSFSSKSISKIANNTIFANDITYDKENNKYILNSEQYIKDSKLTSTNVAETLKNYHYTCFTDDVNECTNSVNFVYLVRGSTVFYLVLTDGENIDDAIDNSFNNSSNTTSSNVKNLVDNWYVSNILNYEKYLEDTVYCNDRSIYSRNGWSINGSIEDITSEKLNFSSNDRIVNRGEPTLYCKNKSDRFTVSSANGNGALDYPIGLLTLDEAVLSGYIWWDGGATSHLHTGSIYWTMTPTVVSAGLMYISVLYSIADNVQSDYTRNNAGGVRPVISLNHDVRVLSGYGTVDEPFIINENM